MTRIGRFELDLEMRTLSCDGKRAHIGARAFDILALLTSRRGHPVTKHELIRYAWPHTIVEENNLQVHLSALRKVLGDDRELIITLPGRGYQLAPNPGDTVRPAALHSESTQATSHRAAEDPPLHASELFGRDTVIQEIADMLKQARIVTLVGAGGIGKTCLATAVARHVANQFTDGVHFAGLAAHHDTSSVLTAVADACGLTFTGGTVSSARIASALTGRRCLIILDNAEHVIDVAAEVAEIVTSHDSNVQMLTTSREPLRVTSESVFRVQPLDVPSIGAHCQDVLRHSAVQLFLHRARTLHPGFGENVSSVSLVGEVCRRLDGIPLAIELAAARAATFGIDGLHRRLDDRLKVLTGGSRTALPRHQTLRATFDWSYALLDQGTRAIFRWLSRFADHFALEDACSRAVDEGINPLLVAMSISELAEKSLLGVEFEGTLTRYRLAESTLAYAREKLHDEGEDQKVSAAHSRQLQQRFERAWRSACHRASRDALANIRNDLADARNALDWAFWSVGKEPPGVEPPSALAEPLMAWSLIDECFTRIGVAIEALERLPKATVQAACELRLRAALASAPPFKHGSVDNATRRSLGLLSCATEEQNDPF